MAAALGAQAVLFEELAHLGVGGVPLHHEILAIHQGGGHHAVWRLRPVAGCDAEQRLLEQLGEGKFLPAGGGEERQVDLARAQPLLDIIVSPLIYFHFDLRVLGHKALEDARQHPGADGVERAQFHLALFQAVEAGDALLQGLVAVEHRPDGRVERSAIAGHGYAVFAAVEPGKAQFLLHHGNGVADG